MKPTAKRLIGFVAAVAALAITSVRGEVEVGKAAPDFTLKDIHGKTHRLSDYKGKVVVLEWNNPGCPVVQRHYNSGNMQRTQKVAANDGVVWLQINTSGPGGITKEKAEAWQKKVGAQATAYLHDSSGIVGRLYRAQTTPHMFIINKDGTLAYQGAIDDNPNAREADTMKSHNYVKAALAAIKAGQPIEKTATKAYGCAVKYPKADT